MVFLLTASLIFLSLCGLLQAIPLVEKLGRLSPSARNLLKKSTPAAPHFVAYNDAWLNPLPSASDLEVRQKYRVPLLTLTLAQGFQRIVSTRLNAYMVRLTHLQCTHLLARLGLRRRGPELAGTLGERAVILPLRVRGCRNLVDCFRLWVHRNANVVWARCGDDGQQHGCVGQAVRPAGYRCRLRGMLCAFRAVLTDAG